MKIAVCVDGPNLSRGTYAALQAARALEASEILAIGAGGGDAPAFCAQALTAGATRGIAISDPALEGVDARTLGPVLAAVVRAEGIDLVLAEAGEGRGLVPAVLAHALGPSWGWLAEVEATSVDPQHPGAIVAELARGGWRRRICIPLPAVLTLRCHLPAPAPAHPATACEVRDLLSVGLVATTIVRPADPAGDLEPAPARPTVVRTLPDLVRRWLGHPPRRR